MRNLLCGLIVLLASGVGQAGTVYTGAAAWNAAVTGVTTINFEGIAPDGVYVYYGSGPGASVAVGGVSFAVGPASPDGMLFVSGDNTYYPMASVNSQRPTTTGAPNDLLITLPSAVTAVAFDFGDFNGQTATITLSGGTFYTETAAPYGTTAFFGVTAPGGITSVDITEPAAGYTINVTDFSYGTAATAPEPSSLLLFGAGLAGVAGILRRRRRTS